MKDFTFLIVLGINIFHILVTDYANGEVIIKFMFI
jgi:hypothetical protein